jgi:BirA family transcriptional regulator, biotin operon repressor / biotin---[acetyl-CoA-carboxylase] ligase
MPRKWPIISLKKVDSTNNYARLLIEKNELTDETVITASNQHKGRGLQHNSWESEAGKNLTLTLVLFNRYLKAEKQFYLAQAVTLGLVDFFQSQKINVQIKWPNDMYAGEKKIAGILIENLILNDTLVNSLIGIGVNVNQQSFSSILQNAQSMKNLTNIDYDLNELLNKLLGYLDNQIERLKRKEFFILKKEYLERLYRFEKRSQFLAKGKTFYGKIIDVDENGKLVILTDKGERLVFMFKEVQFIY